MIIRLIKWLLLIGFIYFITTYYSEQALREVTIQVDHWRISLPLWFAGILWLISGLVFLVFYRLLNGLSWLKKHSQKKAMTRILTGYHHLLLGNWIQAHRLFTRATHDEKTPEMQSLCAFGGQLTAELTQRRSWPISNYPLAPILQAFLKNTPKKGQCLFTTNSEAHCTLLSLFAPHLMTISAFMQTSRRWRTGPFGQRVIPFLLTKATNQPTLHQLWRGLPRKQRNQPKILIALMEGCIRHQLDSRRYHKNIQRTLLQTPDPRLLTQLGQLTTPKTSERINWLLACHKKFPDNPAVAEALADLYRLSGCFQQAIALYESLPSDHKKTTTWHHAYCLTQLDDPRAHQYWLTGYHAFIEQALPLINTSVTSE